MFGYHVLSFYREKLLAVWEAFFLPKRRKSGIIILSIDTVPLLLLLVISLEASSVQAGLALFLLLILTEYGIISLIFFQL